MDEIADSIARLDRALLAWEGVRAAAGRFDSVRYTVGTREIGHVHRDGIADLPFPRRVREEVLASGRADVHRAGVAGFVSAPVRRPEEIAGVVALFRLNYERALVGRRDVADAGPTESAPPTVDAGEPNVADTNAAVIAEFRANRGAVQAPYPDPPPMLLLHTIGARSGREHVVPMRCLPDGDAFYVFASAHGSERHPDWYHNLLAHPEIDVEVGTDTIPVRATDLRGEERDAVFARQAARFPAFADYAWRLDRTIPVLRLDPRPA